MADQLDAAENLSLEAVPVWYAEMLGRYRIKPVSLASSNDAVPKPSPESIERFQTQKTALLFAALANSKGALLRDDLTLRLWPDADAATGRDRLSQALSWLRRNLETRSGHRPGSVLQADRWRISLTPGSVTTDVAQFESLLAKANHAMTVADYVQVALCLEAAISLYGGPLLPGLCEDDDNLFHVGRRVALAYEDALRDAAQICERLDRLTSAVSYARRLLAVNATDWDACYLTLRLLHRLGEHDEAHRTFAAFKRRYRESTGQSAPLEWERLANAAPRAEARTAVEGGNTSGQLPSPLTRYFGREEEIIDLSARLTSPETRLLSLVGPGGSGKTRLAIELARRLDNGQAQDEATPRPVRRAFFVPLETILRARGIVPAIYLTLDAGNPPREDGAPLRSAVASMLRAAADHPLLVLDNVEHLAEDADTLRVLTDLLERVSSLTILATSRRPLGHSGEQIFTVQPLPIPTGENTGHDLTLYPSVRLFVDRAKSARGDFALTPSNGGAIASLCARLEGLPLAIELCAAWSATLTPDELLTKLTDRFSLLVTRRPDVPPRHRGMYAAIDTSFAQISQELRDFLSALSVFRGGWFAEAAPYVVEGNDASSGLQANDFLARLHEHSLLVTERVRDPYSGRHDARTRFRLLDTIREFAEGQISPADKQLIAKQHAAYYLSLAEAAAPHLYSSAQRAWMDALECEHDNLRAAFAHFEQVRNYADGLRLAVALLYFWNRRGHQTEACEYLEHFLSGHVIETGTGSAPDRAALEREAMARNGLGRALQARGETGSALQEQETALRLWQLTGNTVGVARSLWELGTNARRRGNSDGAVALFEESLDMAESAGADTLCAAVLMDLGNVAINRHDLPTARRFTQASLDRARRVDAIFLSTGALNNLGEIARFEQDLVGAAIYYEEALSVTQTLGDRLSGILPRLNLAEVARLSGDFDHARSLIHECLIIVRHLGEVFLAAQCLFATAVFASAREQWESAAVLAGAVATLRTTMTAGMNFADPDDEAQLDATLRAALGDARHEILSVRGARDGLDAAFSVALSATAVTSC